MMRRRKNDDGSCYNGGGADDDTVDYDENVHAEGQENSKGCFDVYRNDLGE